MSEANLDGVIRYLERRFRDAQKDERKTTKLNMMDLAWVLDTLETIREEQRRREP